MAHKKGIEPLADRVRAWLSRHPISEAIIWFLAAAGCVAVLVWFLGFSSFGEPPAFVYEQF